MVSTSASQTRNPSSGRMIHSSICSTNLFPGRCENVELVAPGRFVAGCKDQLLPIRRKLRERGESAEFRHLFQIAAVDVHQVQLEITAVAIVFVRRKQNLLA